MEGRATSSILIAAPQRTVMGVIADFAAYPAWSRLQAADVVGELGPDGRAQLVRFEVDAGFVRERFVLRYTWHGDERVRWDLAEPGSVITAMSGAYILAGRPAATHVTFELALAARMSLPGMLRRTVEMTVISTALKGLRSRVEAQP
jgi:Polyketide cyclase / dehydrase and lipid transport